MIRWGFDCETLSFDFANNLRLLPRWLQRLNVPSRLADHLERRRFSFTIIGNANIHAGEAMC
jgi:hypothetical protein